MNLLPYVLLFISILSIASVGLFKGYQTTELSHLFFHGYLTAERDARNYLETRTYVASTKTPKSPPSSSKQPSEDSAPRAPTPPNPDKPFISFRKKGNGEHTKLNIAPLFSHEEPLLKNTLLTLLKEGYSNAPFLNQDRDSIDPLLESLIDILISTNKSIPLKEISLEKMEFADETLSHIWYKMLRGTNVYNLEKKEGWPPLAHLILVHPDKNRKAISFNQAKPEILIAYFGKDVVEEILAKESENYFEGKGNKPLSSGELDSILAKHSLTSHKKYLQMGKSKKSQGSALGKDPKTGISVELRSS